MPDPSITFFPVANGDTVLIRLADGAHILVDCNITEDSKDLDEPDRYDVHSDLWDLLPRDANDIPYLDAFVLSHPDQDHCRGFATTFYTGKPGDYSKKHREARLIRIDELWFSPRVFVEYKDQLSEPAIAFRNEADRRVKLHQDRSSDRNAEGNRLRVVGYHELKKLDDIEHLVMGAGTSTSYVNGKSRSGFSAFIHAPFKADSHDKDGARNDTSVVWQLAFDVDKEKRAALVLMGGDAHYPVWEKILEVNKKNNTLEWDIFLSPHHCSWTFFNETPQKENPSPRQGPLDILAMGRKGALVAASSKKVEEAEPNPPHAAAAKEYKKVVGDKGFHVTGEQFSKKKPVPLVFEFTASGPTKIEESRASTYANSAAARKAVSTPVTYGKPHKR